MNKFDLKEHTQKTQELNDFDLYVQRKIEDNKRRTESEEKKRKTYYRLKSIPLAPLDLYIPASKVMEKHQKAQEAGSYISSHREQQ